MKIFKKHSLDSLIEDLSSSHTHSRTSHSQSLVATNHGKSSKKKYKNNHIENGGDKFEERQDTELFFFDISGNKSSLDKVPSYISNKGIKKQHKQSIVVSCNRSLARKKKKKKKEHSSEGITEIPKIIAKDGEKNVPNYNILPSANKKKKKKDRRNKKLKTVMPIEICDDTEHETENTSFSNVPALKTKKDNLILIDIRDSDCQMMSYNKSKKKKKKFQMNETNDSIEDIFSGENCSMHISLGKSTGNTGLQDISCEHDSLLEKSNTKKKKSIGNKFSANVVSDSVLYTKQKRSNSVNEKNTETDNKHKSDMLIDIRDSDCEVYSFKVPTPIKKKKKHRVNIESTQISEYKTELADQSCSDIAAECKPLANNSINNEGKLSEMSGDIKDDILYLDKKKKKKNKNLGNEISLHSTKKHDNDYTLDKNSPNKSIELTGKHTISSMEESELLEQVRDDILHLFNNKKKKRHSVHDTSDVNLNSTPNKKHNVFKNNDDCTLNGSLVNNGTKLPGKGTSSSMESLVLEDIEKNSLHSNKKKKKKRDSQKKTSEIHVHSTQYKKHVIDDTLDENSSTSSIKLTGTHTTSSTECKLLEEIKDALQLFKNKKNKKKHYANETSGINVDSTPNKKDNVLNNNNDYTYYDNLINTSKSLPDKHISSSIESVVLEDIEDNNLHSNKKKKKKKRDSDNETSETKVHSTLHKIHNVFMNDNDDKFDKKSFNKRMKLAGQRTTSSVDSELIDVVKDDILHLLKNKKNKRHMGNDTKDINVDTTPNKKHKYTSSGMEDIKDDSLHLNKKKKKKKRDSQNETTEINIHSTPCKKHSDIFNNDNDVTLDNNSLNNSIELTGKHTTSNMEKELIDVKNDTVNLLKNKKNKKTHMENDTSDINVDTTPHQSMEIVVLDDIKDNSLRSNKKKKKKKRDSRNETIEINIHSTPCKKHSDIFNNDNDVTLDNNSLSKTMELTGKHTTSSIESELIEEVKDDILHLLKNKKNKKRHMENDTSDINIDTTPNKKHNNVLNKGSKLPDNHTSSSTENVLLEHTEGTNLYSNNKEKKDSENETNEIHVHSIQHKHVDILNNDNDDTLDKNLLNKKKLTGQYRASSTESELIEEVKDDVFYLFKIKNKKNSSKGTSNIPVDTKPNGEHNVFNDTLHSNLPIESTEFTSKHTSSSMENEIIEDIREDISSLFNKKQQINSMSNINIEATPNEKHVLNNDNDSLKNSMLLSYKQKSSSNESELVEELLKGEIRYLFAKKKKKRKSGKKEINGTPKNKNHIGSFNKDNDKTAIVTDITEPRPFESPKEKSKCAVLVDTRVSDGELTIRGETSDEKQKKNTVRASENGVEDKDTSKESSKGVTSETSYSNSQDSSRLLETNKSTSALENGDVFKIPESPRYLYNLDSKSIERITENNRTNVLIDVHNSIDIVEPRSSPDRTKINHLESETGEIDTPENWEINFVQQKKYKDDLEDIAPESGNLDITDITCSLFQSDQSDHSLKDGNFVDNTYTDTDFIVKNEKIDEHVLETRLEDAYVPLRKRKRQIENEPTETDDDDAPGKRDKKGRITNEKNEESGINPPVNTEDIITKIEIIKDVVDTARDSDSGITSLYNFNSEKNGESKLDHRDIKAENTPREALGVEERSQEIKTRHTNIKLEENVTDETGNDLSSEDDNSGDESDMKESDVMHISKSQLLEDDDESDEERERAKEKLRRLDLNKLLNVAPLHQLLTRASFPTKPQLEEIKRLNLEVKTGPFSKGEDEKILSNWKSFCEVITTEIRIYQIKYENAVLVYTRPFPFQTAVVLTLVTLASKLDPTIFLDFPRRSQDKKMQFLRYISQGLDNRLFHRIYARFKTIVLKNRIKGGRFSPEEDREILEYMESNRFSHRPYSELAERLGRTRLAIEKRHKRLTIPVKTVIHWTPDMINNYLRRLKKITKCQDIKELEDRQITMNEWRKLSKKMNQIPVRKLQNAWERTIYPGLFVDEDVDLRKIKARIVKRLIKKKATDWREVNWKIIARKFHGFTHSKIYHMFKHLVTEHVPQKMQPNLEESLKFLNDKMVKYNIIPTTHKFKKIEYNDSVKKRKVHDK